VYLKSCIQVLVIQTGGFDTQSSEETNPANDAAQYFSVLQKLICNESTGNLHFSSNSNNQSFFRKKKANIDMLNVLLYNGMIKESTADIVAESGLNLTCLRTIFWRDGEDGLSNTCTFTG